MVNFINEHRKTHGVESICRALPVAPATYYEHKRRQEDPSLLPERIKRDAELKREIRRIYAESDENYGAKKVYKQLLAEDIVVARCTVERLMKDLGLRGVVRGRAFKVTTVSDGKHARPKDLVNRNFVAERPNQLWVADFTYVATWGGFVYVAFVIDVFSRMIVGWRVRTSMRTELTLDALEQALQSRRPEPGLIHHNDAGVQYLSIRYSSRLHEAGIDASVGTIGDSYDNALAETIIGLFKTEVIRKKGPWRKVNDVEYETLKWVNWYNNKRIMESLGYVCPAMYEAEYEAQKTMKKAA